MNQTNTKNQPPFSIKIEFITPDKAAYYLTKIKDGVQRKPSMATIEKYAHAMRQGNWIAGVGAIYISNTDSLLDGQQRLHAVIKSGVSIWSIVVTDITDEAFHVLDRLRIRTLGQILKGLGYSNGNNTIAATKQVALCAGYNKPYFELDEFYAVSDAFGSSVEYAVKRAAGADSVARRAAVVGAVAFAHSVNPKKVEEFYDQLIRGENIHSGMPSYALRRSLYKVGKGSGGGASLDSILRNSTLSAIRAHVEGREMKNVIPTENGARKYFESGQKKRCLEMLKSLGEELKAE